MTVVPGKPVAAVDPEGQEANHAAAAPVEATNEEQQQQSKEAATHSRSDETTATDKKDENENEEEEEERDEEGLLRGNGKGYDVILCGTSLVQSILASALARAGKRVLHVDSADYYGELDAVWTLPYLQVLFEQQQEQLEKDKDQAAFVQKDDNTSSTSASATSSSFTLPLSPRGGLEGFHIHSMSRKQDHDFEVVVDENNNESSAAAVMTPYGKGRVMKQTKTTSTKTTNTLAISLTDWKLANGSFPTLFVGIPSHLGIMVDNRRQEQEQLNQYLVQKAKVIPHQALIAREILDQKSRSLALDMTPGLLYAHGPAVQGLLTSRVADYVEFKSLQGLWWYYNSAATTKATSRLEQVPCSKNDVFTCTLLNPMEKRRLMKFLQLALDYATAQEAAEAAAAAVASVQDQESSPTPSTTAGTKTDSAEDNHGPDNNDNNDLAIVQSLNERHLNQGRSLARPQNKAVNTNDMETLQDCIANAMDFDMYLQEKHQLSLKLRSLVRYALALEVMGSSGSGNENSKPLLVEQGMKRLCRHMQALGRFGSTAFLIPMYGAGELSQAFCRSAAVYGATYILRRAMHGVVVSSLSTKTTTNDKSDATTAAQTPATDEEDKQEQQQPKQTTGVLISQPTGDDSSTSASASSLHDFKQIPCQHVVVPESAILQQRLSHDEENNQQGNHVLTTTARRRVLRRISIVQGKPKVLLAKQSKEDDGNHPQQCRHAILLPPGSLDTNNSISNDHSCPQTYTIQSLVLDESVNVAPYITPDGCSIVHLSTLVDVDNASTRDDEDKAIGVTEAQEFLLKRALDTIILANEPTVQEIFHVSFSFPLYDESDDINCKEQRINGLHVVRRPPPSLTVDPDFEQAREIFTRICPGSDFLTLSKEIETVVKERFGDAGNPNDADDDEKLVLESAMGMISGNDAVSNATGTNAEPLFIWLGRRREEAEVQPRRPRNLLLPVPTPSTPNVTLVENPKQDQDANEPTTSEQVLKLIQKHYSLHGSSSDPRVYFASYCEGGDVMEHASLIKKSIAAIKTAGFSQFSYHVFTSGLVTPPAAVELSDLGIDCFHVSLFAGSKAEYEESTGIGANIDGADEEEAFSIVCKFISTAVQQGQPVEASVLKRCEETGRVLARSLGAREVHVFDQ